jgi:predicted lysophospholipase L1 biosynthesis ABC-type transport system permease subunit
MPIETKVTVASITATVTAFVIWLLNTYVFGSTPDEVASMVQLVVTMVVTFGATFAAGWAAKHTPRPDVPPTPRHSLNPDRQPWDN